MSTERKLENLVGKTWMFRAKQYKVFATRINNDMIEMSTDRGFLQISIAESSKLDEFLPCDDSSNAQLIVAKNSTNGVDKIEALIFDTIEKIKADKGYINQAKAINNNINTLLNTMKLRVQLHKMVDH